MCVLFITHFVSPSGRGRGRAGRRVKVEFITTISTRGSEIFPSDSFLRFGNITDAGKCVRALNRFDDSRAFSFRLHIDDFYYHPVNNVLQPNLAVRVFIYFYRTGATVRFREVNLP